MEEKQNDRRSVAMLVASLVIVGSIGAFRRAIPLSSPLLAFFRGLIGSGTLALYLLLRRGRIVGRHNCRELVYLLLSGFVLGVNWLLLFEAYRYTTVAKATLCYYLEPSLMMLLSPWLFRERLTAKKLLCAMLALVGMVLISGVLGGGSPPGDLKGVLLGLAAACFYALVVILNKKGPQVDAFDKTVLQLFSAALTLLPYLLVTEHLTLADFTPRVILLLLTVGVIHTGLAYALYFGSMDGLRAQTISALSYIDPIMSMFVSALLLKEPLNAAGLLGAALILGSALVGEWDTGRKKQDAAQENG